MLSQYRILAAATLAAASIACHSLASPAQAAALPPIKEVVFFGDSLTDPGAYWFRFTTNPGLTWAQHVALHYGQPGLPNEHVDSYSDVYVGKPGLKGPGGLNYAQGGAKSNSPYSRVSKNPEGTPISTAVQLGHFLKQHKSFGPDQLVSLYVGTNDIAYHYDPDKDPKLGQSLRDNQSPPAAVMEDERRRVKQAAIDEAKTAKAILSHGAKRLIVFKIADLGNLPWFHSAASQAFVNDLTRTYNDALVANLPKDDAILVIDTQAFIADLIQNADKYGFKHLAHEDACKEADQDYCYPNSLKSDDADRTYIFAAGEHLTTHANELLAAYVLKQIEASPLR